MKRRLAWIFALLLAVALAAAWYWRGALPLGGGRPAAAAHAAGPYRVMVRLDPDPPRVGENRLFLRVTDAKGDPAEVQVEMAAQMPAMGAMPAMRAPVQLERTGPGRFGGRYELSMAGPWPLALLLTGPLGQGALTLDMATGRAGVFPTGGEAEAEAPAGAVRVDARRRQMIGLKTAPAELHELRYAVRAAARVHDDERRYADVSLRFPGWVQTLRADYVGAPVQAGEALLTVYSPRLIAAQEDLLAFAGGDPALRQAARRQLAYLGIAERDIRAIERGGQVQEALPIRAPIDGEVAERKVVAGSAVQAGQTLLRLADRGRVWLLGQVYESELGLLQTGMRATVHPLGSPPLEGRVDFIAPEVDPATRAAAVRVEVDNAKGALRPGQYAELRLSVELGRRLAVPESAVLYAGQRRLVFVDQGDGYLAPRFIETGRRAGALLEVRRGLEAGESVVTSGNFLIASESRLQSGVEQW